MSTSSACETPSFADDPDTPRRRRHSKGYILVYAPEHPCAWSNGWAYEHRVNFHDGVRPLDPLEVVHHRDEDKTNNDPDNLYATVPKQHGRIHLTSERAREIGRLGGLAVAKQKRRQRRCASTSSGSDSKRTSTSRCG